MVPLKLTQKLIKIIIISYFKPTYLSLAKAEVYNRIGFLSRLLGQFFVISDLKTGLVNELSDRFWFVIYNHSALEARQVRVDRYWPVELKASIK